MTLITNGFLPLELNEGIKGMDSTYTSVLPLYWFLNNASQSGDYKNADDLVEGSIMVSKRDLEVSKT
jgi:hypothetical protein